MRFTNLGYAPLWVNTTSPIQASHTLMVGEYPIGKVCYMGSGRWAGVVYYNANRADHNEGYLSLEDAKLFVEHRAGFPLFWGEDYWGF